MWNIWFFIHLKYIIELKQKFVKKITENFAPDHTSIADDLAVE